MKKHFILSAIGVLALCVSLAFTVSAAEGPLPSAGNPSHRVVDISSGNGTSINWAKVKPNFDIVYMRASIKRKNGGAVEKDTCVETNAKSAHNSGMNIGYYHYFRPSTDSSKNTSQADFFYNTIRHLPYDCIPVLDVEESSETGNSPVLSKSQVADAVYEFVQRFEQIAGRKPMIYCSAANVDRYMDSRVSSCKFWVAEYRSDISKGVKRNGNSVFSRWDMWQQHGDTNTAGIDDDVDTGVATSNVFIGSSLGTVLLDNPNGSYGLQDITISGWAVSYYDVTRIDIYIDDKPYLSVLKNAFYDRKDIEKHCDGAGYSDPLNSGFSYTIPKGALDGGHHKVQVALITNSGNIWSSPKNINVNIPDDRIWIDGPSGNYNGGINIYGWAASCRDMDRVDIYIDGHRYGDISKDDFYYRSDIASIFKGSSYKLGKTGFSYTLPKGAVGSGNHTIRLAFINQYNQATWSNEKSFSANIPDDNIWMDGPTGTYSGDIGVYGWATTARGIGRIDVYVDGDCIQHIFKDDFYYRGDIASLFKGRGYDLSKTGYSCTIPKGKVSSGHHVINLAFIDSFGGVKWTGERSFNVNIPDDNILMDGPSGNYTGDIGIYGWATTARGIGRIDIYIDGHCDHHIFKDNFYYRSDIARIFANEGYDLSKTGYAYTIPKGELTSGNHTISLAFIDSFGGVKWTGERSFSVNVPDDRLCMDGPTAKTYTDDIGIYGWATTARGINRIDVYVDGNCDHHIFKDDFYYRSDIAKVFANEGYDLSKTGYAYTIPKGELTSGNHTINLAFIDSFGGVTWTGERSFSVNIPNDQICVDGPSGTYKNDVSVYGWALSAGKLKSLNVYVDGKNFTSIKASDCYYRSDIAKIFGDRSYSNIKKSGFSVNLPIEKLSNGDHTVCVKLVEESGKTITSANKSFKVDYPQSMMCLDTPNGTYSGDVSVSGWALSPFSIKNVAISVNGVLKQTVGYDSLYARNDVKSVYKSNGYNCFDKCGFSAMIPHDSFKVGKNIVKVTVKDSKGNEACSITRTITVK